MAAFEVIALDTATPQLRAPGASDTYTFPRAVELPLGTANGVLYLNGSKVVTSGSALTFDGTNTLAVSGTAPVIALNGSSSAGFRGVDFQFAGTSYGDVKLNVNTGELEIVSGQTGQSGYFQTFKINGLEQMRLNSTGLGIGTNNPNAKVHSLTTTGSVAILGGDNTNNFYAGSLSGAAFLGNQGAGGLAFLMQGAEKMRITGTGNVVAGTSAALATNATDGFLYVPTCAGTPTGTPTAITGMAPIVVNTTNNKLYFYSTGTWRDAGP